MQIVTRMGMVVIEDYYHMTILDENINQMKHVLSKFSLSLRALWLLYIYLYFRILNSLFECIHQRKIIPLPYVYYVH